MRSALLYRSRLLAAAERILRDRDEAEDAVQDALVSALRSLDRFRGEAQLSSWLYRITLNAALMRLRSRKQRAEVSLDATGGRLPHPSPALGSEETLLVNERMVETAAALARLPEPRRSAVELRGVLELPLPEVARRIGRSVNATKMLVHRAREQLRRELRSC